jgi:ribosomal-protein-serine acetyltransferase
MFKHDLGDGAELRILELRHAAEFLAFVDANRMYLSVWLGWPRRITSVDEAEQFIRRGLMRFAEDGLPWAGIWQEGRMAGGVLFFPLEQAIRATEIGFWLGQEFAGRGLMARAARVMLGHVFDALRVNRVGLLAEVDNARSRAVAERLGFAFEGVRRQGWVNGDRLVDIAVYALLAEDWRGQKGE